MVDVPLKMPYTSLTTEQRYRTNIMSSIEQVERSVMGWVILVNICGNIFRRTIFLIFSLQKEFYEICFHESLA